MRKARLYVVLVATLLLCHGEQALAREKVMAVFKQHSAKLWGMWQSRLSAQQRVRFFLQQAGMTAALCTTLACSEKTQQLAVEPAASASDAAAQIETTEALQLGWGEVKTITRASIATYQASRSELSEQFYDNMFVHYIENGIDYAYVVDSPDGTSLRVRDKAQQLRNKVALETISGVAISNHPDYGVGYAFPKGKARSVNADGSEQLLMGLPPSILLYGKTSVIFSDDSYLMQLSYVLWPDGSVLEFNMPTLPLLLVDADHLVVVEIKDVPQQHPGSTEPSPPRSENILRINTRWD